MLRSRRAVWFRDAVWAVRGLSRGTESTSLPSPPASSENSPSFQVPGALKHHFNPLEVPFVTHVARSPRCCRAMAVGVILRCAAGPASISPRDAVPMARSVLTATWRTWRGPRSWTSGSVRCCRAWQGPLWRTWCFSWAVRRRKRCGGSSEALRRSVRSFGGWLRRRSARDLRDARGPKLEAACRKWQEEAQGAQPLLAFMSEREIRNLQKIMKRMSFSNLMCMVSQQSTLSGQRLSEALEDLRWRLTRC